MFFLIVLIFQLIEINSMIPSAAVSRTRGLSVQSLIRRTQSESNLRSSSTSSSSISTSQHEHIIAKSKPVTSSSAAATSVKEVSFQHERAAVLNEIRRLRNFMEINLSEVMTGTHNAHIDPVRDGVHGRMRQILLRNVAPAAVGSAVGSLIGFGAFELLNLTYVKTGTTTTSTTTTVSTLILDSADSNDKTLNIIE